jgi:uncharacterized protein (TIGR02118 family)
MAKLTVLYGKPKDPKAFDAYYAGTHIPVAKKIPGLRRYEVSTGAVVAPDGSQPFHLVATLEFATMTDLQAAFGSPEGVAAAADVAKFADGGVQMLIYDTAEV